MSAKSPLVPKSHPGVRWPMVPNALRPLILGLLILAAFLPCLNNGFVIYDDPTYVYDNPNVTAGLNLGSFLWAFTSTECSNWHPFTWLSHLIDVSLFGLNPIGHHVTSILLHSLNGALLYFVLCRLTHSPGKSFITAVLFSLHPLRVESVVWVAERKDVLSVFFGLISLYFYAGLKSSKQNWNRFLSLMFYTFSLLSKPTLVSLPLILCLLDFWPLKRFEFKKGRAFVTCLHLLKDKIGYILLALAFCATTYLTQNHAGATKLFVYLPLTSRLENVCVTYCLYFWKQFYPSDLSVFYPFPPDWWPPVTVLLCLSCLSVITLLAFLFRHKQPFLLTGWFWFILTLLPMIGLVQVGQQCMADRYSYFPSIGLLVALVWTLADWGFRLPPLGRLLRFTIAPLCALLLFLTQQQISHWKNSTALFRHAVEVTPPFYLTRLNLGVGLIEQGSYTEAIPELQASLRLNPDFPNTHHNLAVALFNLGQDAQAEESFRTALKLDPSLFLSHNILGLLLMKSNRLEEAIDQFKAGLALNPNNASTNLYLGGALVAKGLNQEALPYLLKASQFKPSAIQALSLLSDAYVGLNDSEAAIRCLETVVKLQPANPESQIRLGMLLLQTGRASESLPHFEAVLKSDPFNDEAKTFLLKARDSLNRTSTPNATLHAP